MAGKSTRSRADAMQEAFDSQARELGLRLERASFAEGLHYGVGFVPMVGRRRVVTVPSLESPPAAGRSDRKEIVRVVHGWETVDPDRIGEVWQDYLTDPFLVVDAAEIAQIGAAEVRDTLKKKIIEQTRAKYPIFTPRRVSVSRIKVVFVGTTRAMVTARVEEELNHPKMAPQVTNIAHLLLKSSLGWRIAVITKELPH